jgi:hypothetical protein
MIHKDTKNKKGKCELKKKNLIKNKIKKTIYVFIINLL